MEIDVSQLQLGDEFLYAVQGNIVRAKVIRPVQQKKVQPTQGKTYYKSVKCKVAVKETTYSYGAFGKTRTYTKKEYNASDNYTIEKFVDLNYRNIWLIKKED
jgi:hypothetical protein